MPPEAGRPEPAVARLRLPRVDAAPPHRGALLYVLAEPDSGIVCYVGQTREPRRRLLGHLRSGRVWLAALADAARTQTPQRRLPFPDRPPLETWRTLPSREPRVLEEWLALLAHEGKRPRMRCIESIDCARGCGCTFVTECRRASGREAWWIDRLLRQGQPLLNRTLPRATKATSMRRAIDSPSRPATAS